MDKIPGIGSSGSKNRLAGIAMARFLSFQDPQQVKFKKFNNGYRIEVVTDDDSAESAKEFWEENIEPRL